MQQDIRQSALFKDLADDQVERVLEMGCEVHLQDGELLFAEGDPAQHFYVLLEGGLRITRQGGGQQFEVAFHNQPGIFTGEVPLLTGTPYVASAHAVKTTRVLSYDVATFHRLLQMCSGIMAVILSVLTTRVQQMEVLTMQQEKLSALGKLSAGLAHELNNPAAAAQRAAGQVRALVLPELNPALYNKNGQSKLFSELQHAALQRATLMVPLDPLTESDREEELAAWLEEHAIENSWQLAPTFVEAGLDCAWFDEMAEHMASMEHTRQREQGNDTLFVSFVTALEKTLQIQALLQTVEQSTTRISTLVRAVKSYSYMDQAPLQEIDIHDGLESTLTILNHKLKDIKVIREYDRTLPCISAYGSELNQVWTNLLDNAIDALAGHGQICLHTWHENDHIAVEIADDGPGIPIEIQPHVFEPFFTTKGVGKGTGLGLDIAYRIIVRRHKGDLLLLSKPGDTRFIARLPVDL